ncbi:MAG: SDR family oxidoreductase [Acidimicrobiia bacterium]|nr:SDR family oxidoreductase [Acidimicrobiia bacterium]MYB24189.1 SDR family oxidoreductase [Acidimicrobiia bacterium]MYE66968.1 SDR family oxidoreductase [Acidimicrobiia bacterium]
MSVLITGGGSGIGEGAAEHFVAAGAAVTVSGRRAAKVEAVADRLGERCCAVAGDVTVAADRRRMMRAAVAHGGERLDVLINNAGNMYRGPVEELQEDRLLGLFHSNVVAGMMLCGLAVPHLRRTQGCVLFVGSVHTKRSFPSVSPYAATKGALETLTGVLAAELGPQGIRVGCVRPGAVLTEINQRAGLFDDEQAAARLAAMSGAHALGRIGTAAEIAEAFEYLARAEWTTGEVLVVDGGLGLGVTHD